MTALNPLPEQLWAVLYAAGAGILCAVVYDIFRSIRWGGRRRWLEFLLDAIFSIFTAAVLFLLITSVTQLRLRGFVLFSAAGGWLLWSVTAGRIFRHVLRYIRNFLVWLLPLPRHSEKSQKKQKSASLFGGGGIK